MIENKIILRDITTIQARDKNQRSADNEDHIISLAKSIVNQSLIHAIVVNKEDEKIVVGWTRLQAFRWLQENNIECPYPSYKGWTCIPMRFAVNASPEEIKAIELEENIKRSDLTWQDEAVAIFDYHKAQQSLNEEWTGIATANALGLSSAYVSKRLQVASELNAGNEKILSCTGVSAALNIINRQNERAIATEMEQMHDIVHEIAPDTMSVEGTETARFTSDSGEPVEVDAAAKPLVVPATQSILRGDAIEWMQTYEGPKFNFLHADFPYGINHQKSEQGRSEEWGAYEDTPEIFWQLCNELAANINNFMAHSSHIMFWYSFSFHEDVMAFFRMEMPDWDIQAFPMIWHKSDNKGLLPDPNRYGRRTYEVALCLSRGDRKVVSPVALSYAAPGAKTVHLSEKPEAMLRHFFRMFVDEYVSLIDLTCGSGTSLRAAESLNARYVYGIELDEANYDAAVSELNKARTLAAMAVEV